MTQELKLSEVNRATKDTPNREQLVRELFTFKDWNSGMADAGDAVREALIAAYDAILVNVPSSPARSRALNLVVDARMLANQAITFGGAV